MQFLQLELTKAQERQRRSAAPPADLNTSSSSANNRRRNMEAVVRPILQQMSDGTTPSSAPRRPRLVPAFDPWMLAAFLLLTGLGLVMVYSASAVTAEELSPGRLIRMAVVEPPYCAP